MAFIPDEDRDYLTKHFQQEMRDPVKLVFFTQRESPLMIAGSHAQECAYCKETRQLLEELTELSIKLQLETHDFVAERGLADSYGVDKIPATVITDGDRKNIKFFGIPTGYEFVTLIEGIIDVSRGSADLSPQAREALARLGSDVRIQVLVTPT